ncbi:MAG: hypothetical protein ABW217_02600 [Polyangiaceae bacterium]
MAHWRATAPSISASSRTSAAADRRLRVCSSRWRVPWAAAAWR